MRLVYKYNNLCTKLATAIENGRAPANAIAPQLINPKNIFALDVDSDVWNDAGLDDADDIPLWMGNEKVRIGIQYYLEHRHCLEELARLQCETQNLISWYKVEWDAVSCASQSATGEVTLCA